MVMRIKFVKELPACNGLKMTTSGKDFQPDLNDTIYTVTVNSDNFVQIYVGSKRLAEGRQETLVELIRSEFIEFADN